MKPLYKALATAGLMSSLALGSMGCRFDGFSIGFFSYRRKAEPKKVDYVRSKALTAPYILNHPTCNSKAMKDLTAHLEMEKRLAARFEKQKKVSAPEFPPMISEEEHAERFHEEYGLLEESLNSDEGPFEGLRDYLGGNSKADPRTPKPRTNLVVKLSF